jgi:glycerophosphoryl diester phosphodiesterase
MIVVAHRGSSGSAPENTMAAFLAAATAGADLIELDVRFSAECTCVVMHDRSVRRTTNGVGYVHKLSLASLRRLDAGRWFSPAFTSQRIPTFAEVLQTLPPTIGINCEVKTDGDPRPRTRRAHALLETLHKYSGPRSVIVSSFDHRFLSILSRHAPALPLGVLLQPLRDLPRRASIVAHRAGASFIFCGRGMIRHRIVADARRSGMSVGVYTVDTLPQLARARRYGVDMVFTNYPEKILPWLATD